MGKLSAALDALKAGGFRADYAYPGQRVPAITDVVAAVSLKTADLSEDTTVVLVNVLCPADMGGAACEAAALEAGSILQEIGGKCTVFACEFDGRTGLFSARVEAVFAPEPEPEPEPDPEPEPETQAIISCTLGLAKLWHTVSFTTEREVTSLIPAISDAAWHFRLEEFFPADTAEEAWPEEPFHVINGKEILLDCTWTSHRRIREPGGIRQIREGVAGSRSTE